MPWFYYIARGLVIGLFKLLTRWQVKGKENVPKEGPVLVVANHINLADPPLLGISLDRKVIFMAKEELFRSSLGAYFVSGLGSFPVHRGKMDRQALRRSQQVLADNLALAMFPEATRSRSARLKKAMPGSALIACRSGVPILPVGIIGTEQIKGMGWILRRPRLTINIGKPFSLPPVDGKLTREKLVEYTDLIMQHIAELLPPQYRGIYAGKVKP
ncbi:MAG: 1-acyl-sn-glycerol-3-phosphate acyltransferase [Deltaproteobacteria bacterium]|nr:1-acyl-sn-glycerol-3-phosphate acyltransferase [Deltaproteobacteria bacterium]